MKSGEKVCVMGAMLACAGLLLAGSLTSSTRGRAQDPGDESDSTNCFSVNLPPTPTVDGDLLQVMPWPNFKDLTDREIRAIYEYLKAVPCIRGNYPGAAGLGAGIPPEPADRCQ